jgi:hypothetical protein
MFFSLSLSIFVGLVHYFSRFFKPKEGEKYYRVFSFSAGISISYLFLDLFPYTYSSAEVLKNWVFVFRADRTAESSYPLALLKLRRGLNEKVEMYSLRVHL